MAVQLWKDYSVPKWDIKERTGESSVKFARALSITRMPGLAKKNLSSTACPGSLWMQAASLKSIRHENQLCGSTSAQQMVRYLQDYPNPRLSLLDSLQSPDYYVNQGNFQISSGYAIRF